MRFIQSKTEQFKDYVAFLVEWSGGGGYQRGGTLAHGRDSSRDEKKLTKSEEIELAEQSPIFRKHMSPTGWKFVTTVHAAARAFQRRLDFEFQQWREIHDRVASRCDGFDRWKKGDNFVLFYSKSYQQGYVTNVYPDTKTIRIITVLPKGKNLAPAGTAKVLVESTDADFEMYLMEAAEVEAILREDALEEIDKSTLKSYLKKADKSAADHSQKSREAWEKGDKEADDKHFTKAMNREKGKIGAHKRLNEAAQSTVAPDGMLVSRDYGASKVAPRIGDWVSYKVHYSMLSSAGAFEIVGFSGKSTLIVQEYEMKDNGSDHRVLTLDPTKKKAGPPIKLRVSARGDIKIGSQYADFHTREEVQSKGIRYSGSRYD